MKLNPNLQTLPVYQPGRPIEEVARELGLAPEDIIKLASNETPLGPSPKALAAMQRIDEVLTGRDYLAGENYSMADIVLLSTIDFASFIGVVMPDNLTALADWHARISARPSALA